MIDISIQANGYQAALKEKERSLGKMGLIMKVPSKTEVGMGMELTLFRMENSLMLEISLIIRDLVMVS